MPDVTIRGLGKEFAGNVVLDGVDIAIEDGEFFTLLGPSGCGKSTTLACLAGLERPSHGTIAVGDTVFFDGARNSFVPPEARDLGMVFQSYALWPHMTLAQNLAMPLDIRRVPKARQRTLIHDALDKVGMAHLAQRFPHQLSGGQQQRVALARALVYSPKVLLLDEPLSNLDAKLREQARVWLKKLQGDLGITTIYVTHDQDEALAMSDRIAVMSGGRLQQVGTPEEIYETPATAEVAGFIGKSNFVDGIVTDVDEEGIHVRLEGHEEIVAGSSQLAAQPGDEVTVAFRPEKAALVPAGAPAPDGSSMLHGEVLTTSYVGSRVEYTIRFGHRTLLVEHYRKGLDGRLGIAVPNEAFRVYPRVADAIPEDVRELMQVTAENPA